MLATVNDVNYSNFKWTETNVADRFGVGFVYYFRFLKFLILYNFILFIISWIAAIPHFVRYIQGNNDNFTSINSTSNPNNFIEVITLTSYIQNNGASWYSWCIFSAISMIVVSSMSLVYSRIVKNNPIEDHRFGQYDVQHHKQTAVNAEIQIAAFSASPRDNIEENSDLGGKGENNQNSHTPQNLNNTRLLNTSRYSRCHKIVRNSTSLFIFAGLVVAFSVIIYYVQSVTQPLTSATLTSLVLALVYSCITAIFTFLIQILSLYELHDYDSTLQIGEGARLFAFRIICYFAFYLIRNMGLQKESQLESVCSDSTLATQQLLLSMNYIYSDLVSSLFFAYIVHKCLTWTRIHSVVRNDELKMEFKLGEQYSQTLFRQCLLSGGLSYLFGAPLSACFGHYLQYHADKYQLLHLTYAKVRNSSTYLGMIHVYNVVFTLYLLFGYQGFFWIWIRPGNVFSCDSLNIARPF